MKNILKTDTEKHQERFFRFLPENNDITSLILKGHLLIEEILNNLIDQKCKLPCYIEEAKLTFFQKIKLLQALIESDIQSKIPWNSLESLNILRNQISHNIEPKDFETKIENFIFARFNKNKCIKIKYNDQRIDFFRKELCFIAGYLESIWSRNSKA
jgi:hypothetical protein